MQPAPPHGFTILWPFFHVLVVASTESGLIGQAGQLPWSYPLDLRFFRLITHGSILWMGRSTLLSLPDLLPARYHLVLTHKSEDVIASPWYQRICAKHGVDELKRRLAFFSCLDQLPEKIVDLQQQNPQLQNEGRYPIFCVGGAQIFNQAWSKVQVILWTEVKKDYQGDCFLADDLTRQLSTLKRSQSNANWQILDRFDTQELTFYFICSQAPCVTLPWPLERLRQSLYRRWRWILEQGSRLPIKQALEQMEGLSYV